jgi:hypothetical protein
MHLKSYLLKDSAALYYDVNSFKIYLDKNGLLLNIFIKERGAEIFREYRTSSPPRPVRAL